MCSAIALVRSFCQAQVTLLVLFINILLEMAGKPFRVVTKRHRILRRLELTALITLWGDNVEPLFIHRRMLAMKVLLCSSLLWSYY